MQEEQPIKKILGEKRKSVSDKSDLSEKTIIKKSREQQNSHSSNKKSFIYYVKYTLLVTHSFRDKFSSAKAVPKPEVISKIIGSYLHQVPEASPFCNAVLGVTGDDKDFVSHRSAYGNLKEEAKQAYSQGKLACAVARRLLAHGRGNVAQDVISSNGKSRAGLLQKRKGFEVNPLFKFGDPENPINLKKESIQLKVLRSIACKAGNCGEHADLAYVFLNTLDLPKDTKIFRCSNRKDDHGFLIMAVPCKGQKNPTLLICDPWIDYVGRLSTVRRDEKVSDLVKPHIYETAQKYVEKCMSKDKSHLASEELNAKNKLPLHEVSQPPLQKVNIFTYPAVESTVGKLKDDWRNESNNMQEQAKIALNKANEDVQKRQNNPNSNSFFYVMPKHEFQTGDNASIPKMPEFKK